MYLAAFRPFQAHRVCRILRSKAPAGRGRRLQAGIAARPKLQWGPAYLPLDSPGPQSIQRPPLREVLARSSCPSTSAPDTGHTPGPNREKPGKMPLSASAFVTRAGLLRNNHSVPDLDSGARTDLWKSTT